jgi:hypothetical protein
VRIFRLARGFAAVLLGAACASALGVPALGAPASKAAAFPDVLHACGTRLCDSTGAQIPRLQGFSIQDGGPWSQKKINQIHAEGATFLRMVVFWNKLQSTDCSSLSAQGAASYLTDLRTQAMEAETDGIYSYIELHLNTGQVPACADGGTGAGDSSYDFTRYMASGQWITNYLANYFGNPSNTATYVKSIVGFGLNEPPPPYGQGDATNVNTQMEQDQSTMITWFRGPGGKGGPAPQWIAFVAYPFASSTPIFNDAFPGQQNQCTKCANANPHAYDAVGGNVVLDVHDYLMGCTSKWHSVTGLPPADCDGRQYNGEPYTTKNGGWAIHAGQSGYPTYPPAGENELTAQSQLAAFLKPYKDFTQQAQWPLMIGESGWAPPDNTQTGTEYATDLAASWADTTNGPKAAIRMEWDFDTNETKDNWSAEPGSTCAPNECTGGWLDFTNTLFHAPF